MNPTFCLLCLKALAPLYIPGDPDWEPEKEVSHLVGLCNLDPGFESKRPSVSKVEPNEERNFTFKTWKT